MSNWHDSGSSRRSEAATDAVVVGRRTVAGAMLGLPLALRFGFVAAQDVATPETIADELVIDMAGGPDNLDPALTRSIRDWSVLHAIYDSILDLSNDGTLVPLAAESFEAVDEFTYKVVLRDGLVFHDGSSVTATDVQRSIEHVKASEGPAAANFGVVLEVEVADDRTAILHLKEAAPWLPSQLAVWMVLFPESAVETFETEPVGSGPYRFVSRTAGSDIVLELNPDYPVDSPKGRALANTVRYRFVPEATTRIADLAADVAHIADSIGQDQIGAVEDADATAIEAAVLGTSFLRMVNDVAPFDDARVRQAINLAIDVQTIGTALVSEKARRLASLFPDERSIGFNPELQPFEYDPDQARALLAESGYEDGFETSIEYTGGNEDVMQAIAANLEEVGIRATLKVTELATFNGTWTAEDSAPLRYVSWRPVYDPHTLLSLMFASTGPLSRYEDSEADALIRQASTQVDADERRVTYQNLGTYFQESPPAVFLWNLTSIYGVKGPGEAWTARGDEYVLPLARGE